ncbi:MAG: ankyrin repeat domain-containing protein [Limnohabitans sp.]|nr:ankyrin repeat domain-containing protein [Limnohabitans sp.]
MNSFKLLIYLIVLIHLNTSNASSFDDFFKAIEFDQPHAIEYLLKKGFDANTPNEQGQIGLHIAINKGFNKVAKVLIEWPKTQLSQINPDGESALMFAALNNNLDLAKLLIERGADVNKPGWTPLHYAATKGHNLMVRVLLENHAYIDSPSPNGTTPLMMAAQYGTPLMCKLLLEEGADPTIKNQKGLTAIEFAKLGEKKDSIPYIESFIHAWNTKK